MTSIRRWDIIDENYTIKPFNLRPVITFTPSADDIRHIMKNSNIVKVRITGTDGYDGEWWGASYPKKKLPLIPDNMITEEMYSSKEWIIILRIRWESYPYQNGQITVLKNVGVESLPDEMKYLLRGS